MRSIGFRPGLGTENPTHQSGDSLRFQRRPNCQKVLETKVIVGQEYQDKATPVFADSMETVVFRPYWNVTPDIAAKEIFPKGQAYLERENMETYQENGQTRVRQHPDPKNALGFVKFLFLNDFNIYLHDTPNHELFKEDVRSGAMPSKEIVDAVQALRRIASL